MGTVTRLDTGLPAAALLHVRIQERREQLGMAQAALARRIGVHKSAMTRIEKGDQKVSTDQLAVLAATLRVSLDWLVLNQGPSPEPFEIDPDDADRRFRPDDAPDSDPPKAN